MRIEEDFSNETEAYSDETKRLAAQTFLAASQISELKKLILEIKKNSGVLRELFLTEEELDERRIISDSFDAEMQKTIFCTTKNLESYLRGGWKELVDKGEIGNG